DRVDAELLSRLHQVRNLLDEAGKAAKRKQMARAAELYGAVNREWKTLRPLALQDAPTLMALLRAPESRRIFEELIWLVFSDEISFHESGSTESRSGDLPRHVAQALGDFISSGTTAEKKALLRWIIAASG